MVIHLKLFSPLSDAAGAAEMSLSLEEGANLRNVVEKLVARFGGEMKKHLFDGEGRIIPSWAVFINKRVIPFNQPDALEAQVEAGDEVSFILNIAGG